MKDQYKHIQTKEEYIKQRNSGMFFEFHPELSGEWETDEKVIKTTTTDNCMWCGHKLCDSQEFNNTCFNCGKSPYSKQ